MLVFINYWLQYVFENIPPKAMCTHFRYKCFHFIIADLRYPHYFPHLHIKFKTCGKSVLHTEYIFDLWHLRVITAIWMRTEALWDVISCQMVKAPTCAWISLFWLLDPDGKALWSFTMSVNVFTSQYSMTTNMTSIFSASFCSATIVPIYPVFPGLSHCWQKCPGFPRMFLRAPKCPTFWLGGFHIHIIAVMQFVQMLH